MPKLRSIVALFAFAGALLAQSPYVGTWILDNSKSKYTAGKPAKDATVVIEEQGDKLQVHSTGTNAEGLPITFKYVVPLNGGVGQLHGGLPFDAVNSKRISASEGELSFVKNGKVVLSRRTVVSKDGKSMKSTVKGVDPMGNALAGTEIYQKR